MTSPSGGTLSAAGEEETSKPGRLLMRRPSRLQDPHKNKGTGQLSSLALTLNMRKTQNIILDDDHSSDIGPGGMANGGGGKQRDSSILLMFEGKDNKTGVPPSGGGVDEGGGSPTSRRANRRPSVWADTQNMMVDTKMVSREMDLRARQRRQRIRIIAALTVLFVLSLLSIIIAEAIAFQTRPLPEDTDQLTTLMFYTQSLRSTALSLTLTVCTTEPPSTMTDAEVRDLDGKATGIRAADAHFRDLDGLGVTFTGSFASSRVKGQVASVASAVAALRDGLLDAVGCDALDVLMKDLDTALDTYQVSVKELQSSIVDAMELKDQNYFLLFPILLGLVTFLLGLLLFGYFILSPISPGGTNISQLKELTDRVEFESSRLRASLGYISEILDLRMRARLIALMAFAATMINSTDQHKAMVKGPSSAPVSTTAPLGWNLPLWVTMQAMAHIAQLLYGNIIQLTQFARLESLTAEETRKAIPQNDFFSFVSVAERAIEAYAPRAARQGLNIRCRLGPGLPSQVLSNEAALSQVLESLLLNAITHSSHSKGTIDMFVVVTNRVAAPAATGSNPNVALMSHRYTIKVEVKDSNKILSESDVHNAFKDSVSTLHFAVIRRLIRAIGGNLNVLSAAEKGSTFALSFEVFGRRDRSDMPIPPSLALAQLEDRILVGIGLSDAEKSKLDYVATLCDMKVKMIHSPKELTRLVTTQNVTRIKEQDEGVLLIVAATKTLRNQVWRAQIRDALAMGFDLKALMVADEPADYPCWLPSTTFLHRDNTFTSRKPTQGHLDGGGGDNNTAGGGGGGGGGSVVHLSDIEMQANEDVSIQKTTRGVSSPRPSTESSPKTSVSMHRASTHLSALDLHRFKTQDTIFTSADFFTQKTIHDLLSGARGELREWMEEMSGDKTTRGADTAADETAFFSVGGAIAGAGGGEGGGEGGEGGEAESPESRRAGGKKTSVRSRIFLHWGPLTSTVICHAMGSQLMSWKKAAELSVSKPTAVPSTPSSHPSPPFPPMPSDDSPLSPTDLPSALDRIPVENTNTGDIRKSPSMAERRRSLEERKGGEGAPSQQRESGGGVASSMHLEAPSDPKQPSASADPSPTSAGGGGGEGGGSGRRGEDKGGGDSGGGSATSGLPWPPWSYSGPVRQQVDVLQQVARGAVHRVLGPVDEGAQPWEIRDLAGDLAEEVECLLDVAGNRLVQSGALPRASLVVKKLPVSAMGRPDTDAEGGGGSPVSIRTDTTTQQIQMAAAAGRPGEGKPSSPSGASPGGMTVLAGELLSGYVEPDGTAGLNDVYYSDALAVCTADNEAIPLLAVSQPLYADPDRVSYFDAEARLPPRPPPPDDIPMEDVFSLSFDALKFSKGELIVLVERIFAEFNLFDLFDLNKVFFRNFVAQVGRHYFANPYHNFHHGFSVMHVTALMCQHGAGRMRLKAPSHSAEVSEKRLIKAMAHTYADGPASVTNVLGDLRAMGCLIAALCHDIGHLGSNNDFLVQARHPLAIRYNDRSVLESYHSSCLFELLTLPGCDFLSLLPFPEYKQLRKRCISSILSTDMTIHKDLTTAVTELSKGGEPVELSDDQLDFMCDCMVHAADISNPLLPLELYVKWTRRIVTEFYNQHLLEDDLGLEGLPFMKNPPEDTKAMASMQLGFIDFVIKPFWLPLTSLIGERDWPENLKHNYKYWQEQKEQGVTHPPFSNTLHKHVTIMSSAPGAAHTPPRSSSLTHPNPLSARMPRSAARASIMGSPALPRRGLDPVLMTSQQSMAPMSPTSPAGDSNRRSTGVLPRVSQQGTSMKLEQALGGDRRSSYRKGWMG